MDETSYGGDITALIARLLEVVHVNNSNAYAMGIINAITSSYAMAMANMAEEVTDKTDIATVTDCMNTFALGYVEGRKLCGVAYPETDERVLN